MTVAVELQQATAAESTQIVPPKALRNLSLATTGMLGLKTVLACPAAGALAVFVGIGTIAIPQLKKSKVSKWKLHLFTAAGMAFFGAGMISVTAPPAQALFFSNAETAFTTAFPLSSVAVTTIFTIIRAVYVAYLVYSAINIWTAFDRNEDWMSVAKAPVIAFAAGELTDAVAQVITA